MTAIDVSSAAALVGTDTLKRRYIRRYGEREQEIQLSIKGISCAGCIPGLETGIRAIPGVRQAAINHGNFRATVVWDPAFVGVEELLDQIAALGYSVAPFQSLQQEQQIAAEKRTALRRILLALGLGMQVMMITVALYLGDAMGMDAAYRHVLRYAAMLLTLPVLVFSARPFFVNAWQGVKRGSLNVDLPVSLALLLAYGGSVATTFGYPGQVYFESVVMFVVLLLGARYIEVVARYKSIAAISEMEKSIPEVATRVSEDGQSELVDVNELSIGDRIRVAAGELIPADGTVVAGTSMVDESIVTGESAPVSKRQGDFVIGGSVNVENGLTLKVGKPAGESVVGNLVRMTSASRDRQSSGARLADTLARQFVLGVLLIAVLAGGYWWMIDRSLWLPVVISTLVVACPCALALATPTAFTAAMSYLGSRGILPVRSTFLDNMRQVDHVVFDKTGTITIGKLQIVRIDTVPQISEDRAVAISQALSRDSRHPLSLALARLAAKSRLQAGQSELVSGAGARGIIDSHRYAIGSARFVEEFLGVLTLPDNWPAPADGNSICMLAGENGVLARFELADSLRPDASALIAVLKRNGIGISICSGDSEEAVRSVAANLAVEDFHGLMLPDEKAEFAGRLKRAGKHVAVVGDGLNDTPLMAEAYVSIAMGNGADLSKVSSDVVLLHNRLSDLLELFGMSDFSGRVIRQNYWWAVGYNLLAIPAAIFGLVPPWVAALGMSASSLVVSANSLRLLGGKAVVQPAVQPSDTEMVNIAG